MANDVVALLDHLKIPSAHLLGHSMGGRIALEMALNFPGRVKSLIMAASGSGQVARPGPDCIPGLPHWLVIHMVEKGFEKFLRDEFCESDTFFTQDFRERHPEKVEAFFQTRPSDSRQFIGIHPSDYRPAQLGGDPSARRCAVPDAGVHRRPRPGAQQSSRPSRSIDAKNPRSRTQVLNGQSHGFFWQAPEETNQAILDWVKKNSTS